MYTQVKDAFRHKEDVMFVDDTYDMFVENGPVADITDVQFEARMLTGLINSHGVNNRLLAVMHEDDRQRITAYRSLGYTVHTMNGKRSEELMVLIADLVEKINQQPPRKLITVSNNPAFSVLFSVAEQKDVDVSIWLPGQRIPNPFRSYDTRRLEEILPIAVRKNAVVVRLDVENHLIGLHNMGQIPETKAYLDAIKNLTTDLGSVISIQASADWKKLRETLGRDYQSEFEENGVRTIYRINIPGKNTNDIALAGNIQEALERNPEANVFVIGTGDADFLPLVDAIHDRGKKAILIALNGSLSRPLAVAADEVRYLDSLMGESKSSPKSPIVTDAEFVTAMRLANFLRLNRWKFAYYNRLPSQFSKETLEKAIQKGLLKHRNPSEPNTVAINLENITGRQIAHFVYWVTKCLHIYLVERKKDYCDTKFLHVGMKYDRVCRELKIGLNWKDAINWLEAAKQADVVRKETRPHPNNAGHVLSTWWLPDETKVTTDMAATSGTEDMLHEPSTYVSSSISQSAEDQSVSDNAEVPVLQKQDPQEREDLPTLESHPDPRISLNYPLLPPSAF